MDERDDINKFREAGKRRKNLIGRIVFIVIMVVIVIIVINWNSIIKPLKDIGSKTDGGGFPIELTGSANYKLGDMGENFFLLTDTYLYTYNTEGYKLSDNQHGFRSPICSANSRRALVYDKNGKSLRLYSKNSEIFSKDFEDTIVFAQMGNDDRSAVVTTSTRFSNYLYVLNGEGKPIFRWSSPDEKIMQVCFGDKDKSIFVSVVGEKDGALICSVLRFEVSGGESETWRASIGGNVSFSLENTPSGVYAVTSSGAFLIDVDTGEIKASNVYSKEIEGISKTDGLMVTVFRDALTNGETAVEYNNNLEASAALTFESEFAFKIYGGKLYILRSNTLEVYDEAFKSIGTYELDDEYSDFIIIDNSVYLLGYNKVQVKEL